MNYRMNRLGSCAAALAIGALVLISTMQTAKASEVYPLGIAEQAHWGATHLVVVTHEDFTTATTNTPQTNLIFNVEAKMGVGCVAMVLKTPFEDTADAAHNQTSIVVGDGTDADEFLTATELNENGTEIYLKYGTADSVAYTATGGVYLTVTPNAEDAVSALNAGEVWIYLKVLDTR
jgi:hypothetical protein